jgi:hypothetical protein
MSPPELGVREERRSGARFDPAAGAPCRVVDEAAAAHGDDPVLIEQTAATLRVWLCH